MAMDCLGWSDNAAAQLVMEGYVKLTQPGELLLTTTRSRGRTLKWQNVWMGLVTLNQVRNFFLLISLFIFVCVFLFSRAHKCIQDNKSSVLELENAADSPVHQVTFGVKQTVQEAAVVLIKDFKNPRPGPSIYRVSTLLLFGYISILTNVCIMQFKKKDPLMLSHCTISSEADELPNFFEIHHIVTKESFICQTVDAGQTQQWLHRLRLLSLGLGRWKQRRNA